jgi:hypothetical protein
MIWHSINDKPPLGKAVLIQACSDYYEVRHLEEVKGVLSGTGETVINYSWYPGGLPLESSKRWAYIEG